MNPSLLIVLTGSLGDVVRGMPLVALLKRGWPGCRIGWVIEKRWSDLARAHSGIDRVLVFERERPIWGSLKLAREIRSEHWDVCLDLQRILKSGVMSALSRAPRRIGFHPRDAKEWNRNFNNEFVPPLGSTVSKITHYLEFAKRLGLSIPEQLDFGLDRVPFPVDCLPPIDDPDAPLLVLIVGSSWPAKDWSAARYVDLARIAQERTSARVALVGGSDQRRTADAIIHAAPRMRCIDLVGRTSLMDLAGILRRAAAAAGPDSGPGHLAAALGTPYVGLFGPTDPRRVAPYRCERLAVVSPITCECQGRRCRRRAGRCMDAITAETVWERLEPCLPVRRSS